MPLTPSDVEQMTFTTALRGYDLDEVDDFLDQVVVAIRDLQGEVSASKTKLVDLERTSGATGADESAVGRALVAAQETADKILSDARAESESFLSTARTEAETYEARQKKLREASDAEMVEHTTRIADVRHQLALLATQVADRLDEMDAEVSAVILSDNENDDNSSSDFDGDDDSMTGAVEDHDDDADSSKDVPDDGNDYEFDDDDFGDDADSSHDTPDVEVSEDGSEDDTEGDGS